jgi:hypothetical protein
MRGDDSCASASRAIVQTRSNTCAAGYSCLGGTCLAECASATLEYCWGDDGITKTEENVHFNPECSSSYGASSTAVGNEVRNYVAGFGLGYTAGTNNVPAPDYCYFQVALSPE